MLLDCRCKLYICCCCINTKSSRSWRSPSGPCFVFRDSKCADLASVWAGLGVKRIYIYIRARDLARLCTQGLLTKAEIHKCRDARATSCALMLQERCTGRPTCMVKFSYFHGSVEDFYYIIVLLCIITNISNVNVIPRKLFEIWTG